jgi:hypothetical protein|eukprot:COSAG01_NODE_5418_length_4274_cov_12.202150_2_plen_112_part_00
MGAATPAAMAASCLAATTLEQPRMASTTLPQCCSLTVPRSGLGTFLNTLSSRTSSVVHGCAAACCDILLRRAWCVVGCVRFCCRLPVTAAPASGVDGSSALTAVAPAVGSA